MVVSGRGRKGRGSVSEANEDVGLDFAFGMREDFGVGVLEGNHLICVVLDVPFYDGAGGGVD